ncbi:ATP-binding protein [Thalassovita aquimarina]|uniref:ATP-binding protein n=1 Tax=Thalassovita aquimarina TaxID=2785917 RepID=UPI0035646856
MLAGRLNAEPADMESDRQEIDALFKDSEEELKHAVAEIDSDERRSEIAEGLRQIGLYKRIIDIQLQKVSRLGLGGSQGLYVEIGAARAAISERLKAASLTAYLSMLERWPGPEDVYTGNRDGLRAVDASEFWPPVKAELQKSGLAASQIAEIERLSRLYFSQLEALGAVNASLMTLRRSSANVYQGLGNLLEDLRGDAITRVQIARDEYDRISRRMVVIMAVAVLMVAVGSILSGVLLGKRLSRQIRNISDTSRKMAEGETGISIPHLDMQNEIGDMAQALKAFSETAEELRRLNLQLEEKIAERTRELEIQTRRAEESSKAKSSFLAHMSHEIRTPMNGVVGMVEILASTDLDDGQRRLVDTINESADHLLRVIDDVLDVSKIEAGKLDLEEMEIDLLQLIERSIETFATTARAANVRLLNFCDPSVPQFVIGDPVRLRQIILNLVGNAVKFSKREDEHEGVVEVYSDMGEDGVIRVHVVDNGIGMSQQTIDGLFKAFKQADPSTTRQFGGTGLGLRITNRLVEMIGGRIEVASVLGEGSEFTVSLPLKLAKDGAGGIDLTGVRLLSFFEAAGKLGSFEQYFAAHGAKVDPFEERRAFLSAVKQAEDDAIVILGCLKESDSGELLADIRGLGLGTKVVILDPSRSKTKGMVAPGTYMTHRFPIHFSDVVSGIRALRHEAEGASEPSVETVEAETKEHAARLPVLMCEDNRINQDVLARQLQILGYSYQLAGNGREGLEKWRADDFGLILTDCHMPEMDGYAMTAAIREKEAENGSQRMPIIAVTANALKEEVSTCTAAGMDSVLTKPVKLDELKAILDVWYLGNAAGSGDARDQS